MCPPSNCQNQRFRLHSPEVESWQNEGWWWFVCQRNFKLFIDELAAGKLDWLCESVKHTFSCDRNKHFLLKSWMHVVSRLQHKKLWFHCTVTLKFLTVWEVNAIYKSMAHYCNNYRVQWRKTRCIKVTWIYVKPQELCVSNSKFAKVYLSIAGGWTKFHSTASKG